MTEALAVGLKRLLIQGQEVGMKSIFMAAIVVFLSGCVATAAFVATDGICKKNGDHCGLTEHERKASAADVAVKALDVDMKIFKHVGESLTAEDGFEATTEKYEVGCDDGTEKVCSALLGCECSVVN